jgi:hypothetical protein
MGCSTCGDASPSNIKKFITYYKLPCWPTRTSKKSKQRKESRQNESISTQEETIDCRKGLDSNARKLRAFLSHSTFILTGVLRVPNDCILPLLQQPFVANHGAYRWQSLQRLPKLPHQTQIADRAGHGHHSPYYCCFLYLVLCCWLFCLWRRVVSVKHQFLYKNTSESELGNRPTDLRIHIFC